MQQEERILGERTGGRHGILVFIFGQMHGNEPAGSIAALQLFEAIDAEYKHSPLFDFKGKIVALKGNFRAAQQRARFINKDLNRHWTIENVTRIEHATSDAELDSEDLEIREILAIMRRYIHEYQPKQVVVIDIHTTTAHGGIFTIPAQSDISRHVALSMYAPVVHGFLEGLRGTSLHYFITENFGVPMTSVCFEAGQHDSPESPQLALSAIINCCRTLGIFYEKDVELRHDVLLQQRAMGLPREVKLIYTHHIQEGDNFSMRKDKIYLNFDFIKEGELIAYDRHGAIYAPHTGRILMPLYQKQGSDGFFIVQEIGSPTELKVVEPELVMEY